MLPNNPASNFNDLNCYPELKKYVLVNLFDGSEQLVSEKQLTDAFTADQLLEMKSNRHKAWFVYED